VIVDDGSTDKTCGVIAEVEKRYAWIKGIYLEKHTEYMGTHLAYVCNTGFEFVKEYCNEKGIPYEYIALVDADNILEEVYFERLMEEFEDDPKLGIASGTDAHADIENVLVDLREKNPSITVMDPEFWQVWNSHSVQIQKSRDDLPMGSARMWRKKCFEETGGYLPVPVPDSVSNAIAKSKGWRTRRFMDKKVIERSGLTKQGFWGGYKEIGQSYFFLGYPLYLTVLKAIKYTFKRPYYTGAAYFYGYILAFVCKNERVKDDEIRYCYKYLRSRELKAHYKEKLKKWTGK
jgi:glycosyltransferase involved in cell wall biosynthesis